MLREELAGIYEKLTGEAAPQLVVGAELEAWQWSNKGVALGALGQTQEVLACYDRALEINPRLAGVWFNKGAVLFNNFQRYREALSCFEEVQRLGYPQVAQAIALCRQRLGQ